MKYPLAIVALHLVDNVCHIELCIRMKVEPSRGHEFEIGTHHFPLAFPCQGSGPHGLRVQLCPFESQWMNMRGWFLLLILCRVTFFSELHHQLLYIYASCLHCNKGKQPNGWLNYSNIGGKVVTCAYCNL